jgi:hypothetical protein
MRVVWRSIVDKTEAGTPRTAPISRPFASAAEGTATTYRNNSIIAGYQFRLLFAIKRTAVAERRDTCRTPTTLSGSDLDGAVFGVTIQNRLAAGFVAGLQRDRASRLLRHPGHLLRGSHQERGPHLSANVPGHLHQSGRSPNSIKSTAAGLAGEMRTGIQAAFS